MRLLGQQRHLDDIEHGLIRTAGRVRRPRIHVAVVCASVGCPMLRSEAFVARRIDAQLDDTNAALPLDRSHPTASGRTAAAWRCRRSSTGTAGLRKQGHRGIDSLPRRCSRHADRLADGAAAQAGCVPDAIGSRSSHDWSLNDAR